MAVAEQGGHVWRHHIVEVAKPIEVDVEDSEVEILAAGCGRRFGKPLERADNHAAKRAQLLLEEKANEELVLDDQHTEWR